MLKGSNISLLRLVMTHSDLFYPQDWYYDEEFANCPLPIRSAGIDPAGMLMGSAAEWAKAYIDQPNVIGSRLAVKYAWTTDVDNRGDRIYVGGINLGRRKGFQIHRWLTIDTCRFINTVDFAVRT